MPMMSIRNAAKTIHRSATYVRGLVDAGKLPAIKAGGSGRYQRLRVDLQDLELVVKRDELYEPPVSEGDATVVRRPSVRPLNPAVAAMRRPSRRCDPQVREGGSYLPVPDNSQAK